MLKWSRLPRSPIDLPVATPSEEADAMPNGLCSAVARHSYELRAALSRAGALLLRGWGVREKSTKPSRSRKRLTAEPSDVLVSAVISTYLLTHLHHVLQRAEYGAQQEGRDALAANYAELRKVLCLDARTMEDASACGTRESDEACQAA